MAKIAGFLTWNEMWMRLQLCLGRCGFGTSKNILHAIYWRTSLFRRVFFLIWNLAILVVCLKMGVPPNPWNVHGIFWIGFFMKNKHPFFGVSPWLWNRVPPNCHSCWQASAAEVRHYRWGAGVGGWGSEGLRPPIWGMVLTCFCPHCF